MIFLFLGEWHPTGRLDPLPEEKFDARSERYFAQLSRRRSSVPDSFDAVAEGILLNKNALYLYQ